MLCRWSRWTGAYEDGGFGITECKWDILNPRINVETVGRRTTPRNLHAHMFMYAIRNYERQSVHG